MINIVYSTIDNARSALKLAWKHKILWIFALLAAGGGMNYSSNSFDNIGNYNNQQEEQSAEIDSQASVQEMSFTFSPSNEDVSELRNVLGVSTESEEADIFKDLGEINLVIPGILVGLSFLIFLPYMIVLALMLKGWSKSSLIAGTIRGLETEELRLPILGKIGRANMWKFVNFNILMMLVVLASIIVIGVISTILAFAATALQQISVLFKILILLVILIGSLFITTLGISTIFAYRYMISHETSIKEALKKGLAILKQSAWKFVKLALLNLLLIISGIIALIIVVGIVGIAFFFLINLGGSDAPSTALLIILALLSGPLLIALAIVMQGLWAFVRTYLEFTYSILYLHTQNIDDSKTIKLIGEPDGV
jgi:hypothetical protein